MTDVENAMKSIHFQMHNKVSDMIMVLDQPFGIIMAIQIILHIKVKKEIQ